MIQVITIWTCALQAIYCLGEGLIMCASVGTVCRGLTDRSRSKRVYLLGRVAEMVCLSLHTSNRMRSLLGESDVAGIEVLPLQSQSSRLFCGVVSSHHVLHAFTFAVYQRSTQRTTTPGFVDTVILSPVLEELLFRGAVLQVLLNRSSRCPKLCVMAQAALFGTSPASSWQICLR